jgi:cation transport ATPase
MAAVDDDDEPTGPRRMADDERPEDAKLTTAATTSYEPTTQTQLSSDEQKNIELRKIALEEMKFHLEERRELHKMMIEDRREQQKEDEIEYERQRLNREERRQLEKKEEHWMQKFWRPMMAVLYMLICAFDFIIAPFLTMAMPVFLKSLGATTINYTQWTSLTLSNGGLIHLAFGAILGISAWGRTQEKKDAGIPTTKSSLTSN